MAKQLKYGEEARRALESGINQLATSALFSTTLSAKGLSFMVQCLLMLYRLITVYLLALDLVEC